MWIIGKELRISVDIKLPKQSIYLSAIFHTATAVLPVPINQYEWNMLLRHIF